MRYFHHPLDPISSGRSPSSSRAIRFLDLFPLKTLVVSYDDRISSLILFCKTSQRGCKRLNGTTESLNICPRLSI
jgi:hypothetical protein